MFKTTFREIFTKSSTYICVESVKNVRNLHEENFCPHAKFPIAWFFAHENSPNNSKCDRHIKSLFSDNFIPIINRVCELYLRSVWFVNRINRFIKKNPVKKKSGSSKNQVEQTDREEQETSFSLNNLEY